MVFSAVDSVRAFAIVEALPLGQPLVEVHIAAIREELVGVVLVRSVGALDLAVELGRPWLDIDVVLCQDSAEPIPPLCQRVVDCLSSIFIRDLV